MRIAISLIMLVFFCVSTDIYMMLYKNPNFSISNLKAQFYIMLGLLFIHQFIERKLPQRPGINAIANMTILGSGALTFFIIALYHLEIIPAFDTPICSINTLLVLASLILIDQCRKYNVFSTEIE